MNELKISGLRGSGQTSALLAIARYQSDLGQRSIVLISPWLDEADALHAAGLPRSVRVLTPAAALCALRGLRPATVLIDEWDGIHPDFQRQLGELLNAIGVRFLVKACA